MHFATLEHVEGFAKGEVTHDVEAVVQEPIGGIDRLTREGCETFDELITVLESTDFIVSEG